jgi:hypothetical protein
LLPLDHETDNARHHRVEEGGVGGALSDETVQLTRGSWRRVQAP